VTVLFALLSLNVIQTVLLQLKIFPCDSAKTGHTDKRSLCNISENENFSVKMQTERSGQSKNQYPHTNTWFRTQLV